MAVVVGRLQIRDWNDREGGKCHSAEVVADSVYFGDSRPREAQGAAAPSSGAGDLPEGFNPFAEIGEEDGELPF